LHKKSFTIHDSPLTIQAGIGTSSKNFKKAVDRNRIKRLIREAYRLQKNPLHDILKGKNQQLRLFIIYTGREVPEFKTVFDKMRLILQRLATIFDEKNITDN
jgi:ribonuclease P protein component